MFTKNGYNFNGEKSCAAVAAILMALLSGAFFFPTVFYGLYPYQRDITYIFQPQQAFVNQIIHKGLAPLWNPYSYTGMPLMANWQSRVFSAVSLPFYFFGSTSGLKFFYPLVMFLGGFFAFCFLRYKNLSAPASFVGALVWILGGYFTTKLEFFSYASTLAFVFAPLLFLGQPLIAGIALALAFMCGYPVFFLIALTFSVFIIINADKKTLASNGKNLAATFLIFIALVLPQALPTAELARESSIASQGGYSPSVMLSNSIEAKDILNIFRPAPARRGAAPHWLKNYYLGFAGFLLVAFGIYKKILCVFSRKNATSCEDKAYSGLWLMIFVLGFLLSFADIYKLVAYILHPLKFIRYPANMMFFSAIAASVLGAVGFEALFRRNRAAGFVILFILTLELFITGLGLRNDAGYAPADYFYEKPPAVTLLQEVNKKNTMSSRFALAPKTLKLSVLKGMDYLDGWRAARSLLKGFTALPYRLMNAYAVGEPLVPSYAESAINEPYRMPSPDDASELFGEILGVRYLLSAEKFSQARHYDLILSVPGRGHLYRLKKHASVFSLIDKARVLAIYPVFCAEDRVVFEIPPRKHNRECFFVAKGGWVYPSWKVYIDGKIVKGISPTEDDRKTPCQKLLLKVPLPAGGDRISQQKLILIYSPAIFSIGLIIMVVCVIFIWYKIFQISKEG